MGRLRRILLGLVVMLGVTPASAHATEGGHAPCAQIVNQPVCVGTDGKDFIPLGQATTPATAGSDAGNDGGQPVALSDTYVLSDYVPTCTGNDAFDAGVLCGPAVLTCQPPMTGLIRYWRYDTTYLRATDQPTGPAKRAAKTYCLGPDTPRVPPVAAIGGVLARDFANLVVLKGDAVVSPKGTTLVNYDNGYYTNAARYTLSPVQILGHTVLVTAVPNQYDWYFGDGVQALDAGPGARGTKSVHHTYRNTGKVAPYVVITWTGTFTVDGGPPQAVFGTATTTGPGTPLQVKQARAELVIK